MDAAVVQVRRLGTLMVLLGWRSGIGGVLGGAKGGLWWSSRMRSGGGAAVAPSRRLGNLVVWRRRLGRCGGAEGVRRLGEVAGGVMGRGVMRSAWAWDVAA